MPDRAVRVRFPPSPTGLLHVGSARTALYNWLFARHTGGKLVLRFEDTDRARSTDEAVEQALRVLEWLGIDWDEGPTRQTERYQHYADTAQRLLDEGKAYRCYCTPKELEAEREQRQKAKQPLIYSGRCRRLSDEQRAAFEAAGRPSVVRLAMDAAGETVIEDIVRGTVRWDNALQGDFIVQRSDGSPTYQFANPLDDIEAQISHVVRGEDLLSSTPRQLAVYRALGALEPLFAHLPMILGPDKKRLSKRHGAVSVEEFRDRGYLPEAMRNYLALIGWSFDDKTTVMTTGELIERFTLERVNSSPGVFDFAKLEWLNGEHLRLLTPDRFCDELLQYLERTGSPLVARPERVREVAPIVQEKLRELSQFDAYAAFLFGPVTYEDEAVGRVVDDPDAPRALESARTALEQLEEWNAGSIEEALRGACDETGLKPRVLFGPVRVAVSGRSVAPGLFESLALLGRDETLARIAALGRRFTIEG
ncbi:MAG: nondiscriminating glutamyl-tRNA synthetase [Gaiellales bacterium]|jgi:glutamyl-tRNA synthetase|nr:nondiscriminating glutamyl-tRNA synthetase [Gaiellales bacterium]